MVVDGMEFIAIVCSRAALSFTASVVATRDEPSAVEAGDCEFWIGRDEGVTCMMNFEASEPDDKPVAIQGQQQAGKTGGGRAVQHAH